VVGFLLLKNGGGIDYGNGDIVGLSGELFIDRNEKIIRDIGWITFELCEGFEDKGSQDGND
jgi:hypothetical protein